MCRAGSGCLKKQIPQQQIEDAAALKSCNSLSQNNSAVKTSHEKFKRPSRSEPPQGDPVLTAGRGYERQREDQRRKRRQRKIPVL